MRGLVLNVSTAYRDAIRISLIQQVPCALLCLLLLDGGRTARICAASMLGYWVGVALVMVRRANDPSRLDLAVIRWGYVPLFFAAALWASFA